MLRTKVMIFSLIFLFIYFLPVLSAEVGIPGAECLFGGICSGGSVCVDFLCLCVDGQRELNGSCVDLTEFDAKKNEELIEMSSRLPLIGLAGHQCGIGGVCRPTTKCIDGFCKCRHGYNPSFGECIRDLTVPKHIPRSFIPKDGSVLRFPS